jgi:hypothetical protein
MTVHDNAHRIIRKATDAAQAIEPAARPRFDITAVTVNPAEGDRAIPMTSKFTGVSSAEAFDIVREQVAAADRDGRAITFTIRPMFPTYWTDFADIVVEEPC